MRSVFLSIVLAASSIAHSESIKPCSVDVIKVVPGNGSDIPDDVTIMAADQVLMVLPDGCPGKMELSEAVKAKKEAEDKLIIAQSEIDQVLRGLIEKTGVDE